jgi:hypothetical protein
MAALARSMPRIEVSKAGLKAWGKRWLKAEAFDKKEGMDFGLIFDRAFGKALSAMLGGVPVVDPKNNSLLPPQEDCVEVGKTRVVGGIRPQNFDVAYRPDGPRVVYDSKTLNDRGSIGRNWQNMINDLAAEASTVHTRFPYCLVLFIVVLPRPALMPSQERDITRTLERLGSRKDELDQPHLAEGISLVIWDPKSGKTESNVPDSLRLGKMNERIYEHYIDRYKNLPPHLS